MRKLIGLLFATILLTGCSYNFNPVYPLVVESIDINEMFNTTGINEAILKLSNPNLDDSIRNKTQIVIICCPDDELKKFLNKIAVGSKINIKGKYHSVSNFHVIDEIVLLPSGEKYVK